MTAPDDLIRRGDAIDAMYGKPYGDAVAALLALPADPVAEAAGKLAEACRRVPYNADVPDECWEEFDDEAYRAYRAAVAARSAGTVPPATKPAPACARCGGAEVLPCPHLREECQRLRHEAKHEPCPECRGTP